MRLGYGLNLEQTQKLVMTPELRQAIAILQLSALELSTFVDDQLLENPLLEVQDEPVNEDREETPENTDSRLEVEWQDYFRGQDEGYIRSERPAERAEKSQFEPFVAAAPTLQEHLFLQLHVQKSAASLPLAEYIIGNLDDNGYLTLSTEEIARDRGDAPAEVERALQVVQSLDPPGVGARSLRECLLLQLPFLNDCPPEMPEFLEHLEDLAAGRMQRIATDLGISLAGVQELADIVRRLDPKPGLRFSGAGDVRFVVPDVVVEEIEGEYIILVNDISVPRLGINQVYRRALNQEDGEVRKFVEQKLNAAAWVIRSIEQRRLTLYKVANAVVKRQEEFLRRGIQFLRPLTLKDIADEVGVHESTVSRATANKYVQTPRGIFEFKFFFATGIGHEQGLTTESIKRALRTLISSENAKEPYSDQKLADLLSERGMKISRRTVAKYRDGMHIQAASARRRY
ncbi:RNA polymerase sigma-54 factor 1 [Peptococcaceae bacterium CEB3]|nr:RNA polymerase sigma-54 factor 1 [Peptococcaceae bacterium CEB3]